MTISGHKTRSVFDRYNVVSERDLKDAPRRLGEYFVHKRTPERPSETDRHTTGTHQANGEVN